MNPILRPSESVIFDFEGFSLVIGDSRSKYYWISQSESFKKNTDHASILVSVLKEFKAHGTERRDLEVMILFSKKCESLLPIYRGILNSYGIKSKDRELNQSNQCKVRFNSLTSEFWISYAQKINVPLIQNVPAKINRVLIVEDSLPIQKILIKVYEKMNNVKVIGVAASVEQALVQLKNGRPDIVSLDMKIEGGTGVDVLRRSDFLSDLGRAGARCILITDCSPSEGRLVLDAMSLGAIAYIQKPAVTSLDAFSSDLNDLIREIFIEHEIVSNIKAPKIKLEAPHLSKFELVAIGSSTGGTEVVKRILAALPEQSPPSVIVQHMPESFTGLYADRLSRETGRPTIEVKQAQKILPGHNYLAAGGLHLVVEKMNSGLQVNIKVGDLVNRFKPSVSVLFDSISKAGLSDKTVALILTGMGKDGAQEMLNLKKEGALTIGQSKESCVVYGMPRAAAELGALQLSLNPEEIIEYFRTSPKAFKIGS